MSHSLAKRKAIYKRDGYKCLNCGSKKDLTLDHIVPLSKGGHNGKSNLQTLCKACNCNKSASIMPLTKNREVIKSINKYFRMRCYERGRDGL